ncbi:MAG: hypothetical protein ILP07_08980 [Treponema sp.]|nr:hypothetical protein [Treponema sp.]
MKKFRTHLFICLCGIFLNFFSSCKFNEPVREYLEYWSTTCQIGKTEYSTPYTELDGKPNLSALTPVEINIYLINPKSCEILKNPDNTSCFTFKDESGSSFFYSDYSETALEQNTTIKIQATLPDSTEGQTITLSGCIWPENRNSLGFTEEQLKESFPELFYTTSFVQNTAPDNVKNMNSSGEGDFFEGTSKHYLSFDIPDLSLKRNHGSRYEVKTYLRESDGKLYYTGSEIISLESSDPGNHSYQYYYSGQEDYLFYEYTVQVLGPHGLRSDMLATDERLGVHQLTESTVTISGLNGLYDEDNYECVEVASNDEPISFEAIAAHEGDHLTVTVDGIEVSEENFTVSGIGRHTIISTSSKDGSRPISVTRKIRIVKTPEPAEFDFGEACFNGFTDTNAFEYIEVEEADSTIGYSITPTEDDTTLSGTVDDVQFNGEINESLGVGPHTLIATIHKQYCLDVSLTRKIKIAKRLESPVYSFTTYGLSGNTMSGFEVIEVPETCSLETYTIRPAAADGAAYISGTVTGSGINHTFSDETQSSGSLPIGEYTISVIVSKEYMTPRPFEKKIKVVQSLQAPSYSFNPGLTQESGGQFIEVDGNSDSISYTVSSESGCTLEVTDSRDNQTHISSGNSYDGTMSGLGQHTLTVKVKKQNYVERTFTKTVTVVQKLQEPTYSFTPNFTTESNGQWIEVDDNSSQITCTVTAESGCTLELTDGLNNLSASANQNTCTLTTCGIDDHTFTVKVKKDNYVERTFTKTVKVVQKLQPPTYSFNPGLTRESNYEWIEVDGDSSQISCTVTAESGCTLEVTDSVNNRSVSANQNYCTLTTSGIDDHTITVKVRRANYVERIFTKTVKVVQKLQPPTYSFNPGLTR